MTRKGLGSPSIRNELYSGLWGNSGIFEWQSIVEQQMRNDEGGILEHAPSNTAKNS
jgi:hypothetical protein